MVKQWHSNPSKKQVVSGGYQFWWVITCVVFIMKTVDSGVEVMITGVRVPGQEARKAVWLCLGWCNV